jgi:lambda family phage portal protein
MTQKTPAEAAATIQATLAAASAQNRALSRAEHLKIGQSWSQIMASAGYGAATSSRLRRRFASAGASVSGDWLIERDREKLVDFSRGLEAGTICYRPFVRQLSTLVVGNGLWPRASGNSKAQKAVELFHRWGEDPSRCDIRGLRSWPEILRAMYQEKIIAGDALMIRVEGTRLQLIEAERIGLPIKRRYPTPKTGENIVTDGVEVDGNGRPIAFHVRPWQVSGLGLSSEVRVTPAEYCSFIAHRDRISMTRGVPMLANALERLCIIDETQVSMHVAAQIAALFALVFTSKSPEQTRTQLTTGSETVASSTGESDPVRSISQLGPGALFCAEEGDEVKPIQGASPPPQYVEFERAMMLLIAGSVGVPIETALLDNRNVNFSTSRMAELAARNTADPEREALVRHVCMPTFRWFVANAMVTGALPVAGATLDEYCDVKWPAPPRRMLDPQKELDGLSKALSLRVAAKDDWIADQGSDPDQVREDIVREMETEKSLGIDKVMPTWGAPLASMPPDVTAPAADAPPAP